MNHPITYIDGYKLDHRRQYPRGTTQVYSNWTPRTSRVHDHTEAVFLGGQVFRQRILTDDFNRNFFGRSVDDVCRHYQRRINGYLGPNTIGTDHIRELHGLGHLPLCFREIPEGTAVPLRVPMLTVENTHPNFGWLPNYFETIMSNNLWMSCTSATTARGFRRMLEKAARKTGSAPEFVDWQGHDFSMRGLPGLEAAQLSGIGHLLYFTGTDTIPAIDWIEDYYGAPEDYLIAGSVAATEHSVMCAGGEEGELATISRLLDLYPEGILSIVSDTWDFWRLVTEILPKLRDRILARNGKVVIRPDSGVPIKILCGDPKAAAGSPEAKGAVRLLWEIFGGTMTSTNHKLLDSHIGTIYGDSIRCDSGEAIMAQLETNGFASANVVFGIGSFTYQYVTRDTYGFAMKATWVKVDGEGRDIFKAPKTDDGMKNSARGRLAVVRGTDGELTLIERATPEQEARSLLRPTWIDGKNLVRETWPEVRARARAFL